MAKKFVKKFKEQEKLNNVEPLIVDSSDEEKLMLLKWYRQKDLSLKIKKQWIIKYINNPEQEHILKKAPEFLFEHPLSAMCRMAERGFLFNTTDQIYIDKGIYTIVHSKLNKDEPEEKVKKSIQELIFEKSNIAFSKIDGLVDDYFEKNIEGDVNDVLMQLELSPPHIKNIISYIQNYINEYTTIKLFSKGDEEEKEGFKSYGISIQKLNKFVKYLEDIKATCEKQIKIKKKIRKSSPRRKKLKSPEEICKKVTLAEESPNSAPKLLSTNSALIYDKQYNKLTYLVSVDAMVFDIKGSSIMNFDEDKSKIFTVKKKFIKSLKERFADRTKTNELKRMLKEDWLRISKAKATGRLNENKLILTVV